FETIESRSVLPSTVPGAIQASLPTSAPVEPEAMDDILSDFDALIAPGLTHWNHPAFFAYFAVTGSLPGVLAESLSAALNVNAMLWRTSPAATELETVTLDWLRQLLALPAAFEGVVYDTASISTLVAIAAAREATGRDIRRKGLSGRADLPALRLYCSEEAHSSVDKAAITLGIGTDGVRKIPTDSDFRMDPSALRNSIEQDLVEDRLPFCVVATVGTTSTTSIDPVSKIAQLARDYGLWLHVDAAYGGIAAIVPEMRWVLEGVDQADSFVTNPHKWLFTQIDFSAFYSRRLDVVRQAFSLVPEYLRTSDDASRNYMDYGPQLGRRFRALKLWFVLRYFGKEGIEGRLREHIRLAAEFAAWVDDSPDWELIAPVPFSTVCFRARPRGSAEESLDVLNQQIMNKVNEQGDAFLSHTRLRDHLTLRLAVGNIRTEERHVRAAWDSLKRALDDILKV
ncbi:MAG TPA: pyridoxal-dependent decarboxylase, partial [Chloroflexota bacterium]